jgi:hypothetical protein
MATSYLKRARYLSFMSLNANAKAELAASLETAGDLDEPEAALQTLARFAKARANHATMARERWRKLAELLEAASLELTGETNVDGQSAANNANANASEQATA